MTVKQVLWRSRALVRRSVVQASSRSKVGSEKDIEGMESKGLDSHKNDSKAAAATDYFLIVTKQRMGENDR